MPLRRALSRLRGTRSVLLVGRNPLHTGYLVALRRLFDDDPRITFTVTSEDDGDASIPVRETAAAAALSFLPRREARRRRWDLVVFADHGKTTRYARGIPRLRIQHGIGSGKRKGGENYRYGPSRVLDGEGRPVYDLIFESSAAVREEMAAGMPALADRIAVVGHLDADEVLARAGERDGCRADLGFDPGGRVVLLWSSWGEESLLAAMGEGLLREAERLSGMGPWRFVVSAHPGWWDRSGEAWSERVARLRAGGIAVRDPAAPWIPYLLAGDVMLADHTSLALFFALLNKPVCFSPVGPESLDPASTMGRLHALCPRLAEPARLLEVLEGGFPVAEARELAREVHSHPGEAAERMRAEVRRLIGLAPPP